MQPGASTRKGVKIRRYGGLTPKQRKFLHNLAKGMTAKDAALAAGYRPATAHNAKENIVEPPVLRDRVKTVLETVGIDETALGEKHVELRNAFQLSSFHFRPHRRRDPDHRLQSKIPGASLVYIKDTPVGRWPYFTVPDNETQKGHPRHGAQAPRRLRTREAPG